MRPFTLTDKNRVDHLRDGTVPRWASRGKAYRFEHRAGSSLAHARGPGGFSDIDVQTGNTRLLGVRITSIDSDAVMGLVAAAPGCLR